MTLPIVTVVRTDENHSVISNDVIVAYFLPVEHQAQPPQPNDNEIAIEIWPANTVYTRSVEKERTWDSVCFKSLSIPKSIAPPLPSFQALHRSHQRSDHR